VSPHLPNRRQPVPLGPGFLPGNSLSGELLLADWISQEKPQVGKGKTSPDFLQLWAERPNGPASLAKLVVPVDAARSNIRIYSFPFDLFNSNFQFEFKLVKFIGT
jgi:hypothetical protein